MSTQETAPHGEQESDEGGGESTLTIVIAFVANLAVAIAKSVVAVITASASMLAEAAHSWADTGNQVFLLIADKRSRRPPDREHPWGHGREAYIWSMFAAMGLFVAGGAVSVWHGITQLQDAEPVEDAGLAYLVLGLAFCFEGASFVQAFRQARREARSLERDTLGHVLRTSDPTLRAVFVEDSAALAGLVIAAGAIALHQITGNALYDAIGSILVGLLLGVLAVVLIERNRAFLAGEPSDERIRADVLGWLRERPDVARVTYLRLEYVGPRRLLLVAEVDVVGDPREPVMATTFARLARDLEARPGIVDARLGPSLPGDEAL